MLVSQSALQDAVSNAVVLLLYDPSKFVVPIPSLVISHHRSALSAQFSVTAPKVINYDPEKPIKMHRENAAAKLAQTSHLQIEHSSDTQRPSGSNVYNALEMLDVNSLITCYPCYKAAAYYYYYYYYYYFN